MAATSPLSPIVRDRSSSLGDLPSPITPRGRSGSIFSVPAAHVTTELYLMVDTSGSMEGPRLEKVKKYIKSLTEIKIFNSVSLHEFREFTQRVRPLSSELSELVSAADALSAGGGTRIELALETVCQDIMSDHKEVKALTSVFLLILTDAEDNFDLGKIQSLWSQTDRFLDTKFEGSHARGLPLLVGAGPASANLHALFGGVSVATDEDFEGFIKDIQDQIVKLEEMDVQEAGVAMLVQAEVKVSTAAAETVNVAVQSASAIVAETKALSSRVQESKAKSKALSDKIKMFEGELKGKSKEAKLDMINEESEKVAALQRETKERKIKALEQKKASEAKIAELNATRATIQRSLSKQSSAMLMVKNLKSTFSRFVARVSPQLVEKMPPAIKEAQVKAVMDPKTAQNMDRHILKLQIEVESMKKKGNEITEALGSLQASIQDLQRDELAINVTENLVKAINKQLLILEGLVHQEDE